MIIEVVFMTVVGTAAVYVIAGAIYMTAHIMLGIFMVAVSIYDVMVFLLWMFARKKKDVIPSARVIERK